ncbi:MAG: hypothetical protein M3Q99_15690 [Acidobacteriota bacterium]|nr:hypothetical protein [Acidobacteriota bacterium]
MIKIKEKSNNKVILIVENEPIKSETFAEKNDFNLDGKYYELFIKRNNIIEKIGKYSLADFPPLYFLSFPLSIDWVSDGIKPRIWFMADESSKSNKEKSFEISLDFSPRLIEWQRNYTFTQYYRELRKIISSYKAQKIVLHDRSGGVEYGFQIVQKGKISADLPLAKIASDFIEIVREFHYQVEQSILAFGQSRLINILFHFPKELKISCEQYLVYFAAFLEGLDINANSSLKEEAGKILFSVTPSDDVEALYKIREALAVYLNLPSSTVLYNDSFQSMQLKQQVENLQHSQRMVEMEMRSAQYALRLAQQNIENQDNLITQQNSFIDNQNKIIEKITSKSVMIDSLENKEELEKFCEGFEVGKSEFLIKHFGFHLNPATVLKNAGRKILGKVESNSILGLDEETNKEN